MSQQIETTTQTNASTSLGDIISALKSKIGVDSSESSMFASLLTETGASLSSVQAQDTSISRRQNEVSQDQDVALTTDSNDEGQVARTQDDHRDDSGTSDVKKDATKEDSLNQGEQEEVTATPIQDLEAQMALALQQANDADAIVADGEDVIQLAEGTQEEEAYEDVVSFLASLFPEQVSEETESLLNQMLAKVESEEGSEDLSPMEALAMAGQIIEEQLRQKQSTGSIKEQGVLADAVDADGGAELNNALAQIAEKMALLKEGRDAVQDKGLDAKLSALASEETEGGDESLWQKMVQDQRMESMGRKDGSAHTIVDKFAEASQGDAVKATSVASTSQVAATATQTTQSTGEAAVKTAAVAPTSTASVGLSTEGARSTTPYDFASQLSAARETKGGTTGLPKAIEQVSVQLHKAVKAGQTEMTVNLKPAELGKVEVKLVFGDNKSVTGVVVAENQTALNLLQKDVDVLVRSLQEAGLDADASNMEFSLKEDSNSFADAQNQKENETQNYKNFGTASVDTDSGSVAEDSAEIYYLEPGRVNLQV